MILNKIINVTVRDKIATKTDDTEYVCGNSDFAVVFDFDDEWNPFDMKTARFVYEGKHQDIVFIGNECPVPVISGTHRIWVGVFAGDLHTTTSAYIPAKKSILCDSGSPEAPPEDVYAQIMKRINDIEGASPEAIAEAVEAYMEEHPVQAELPDGGEVGQVLTKTEDGAVWADIVIPKEYGLITYDQDKTITIT